MKWDNNSDVTLISEADRFRKIKGKDKKMDLELLKSIESYYGKKAVKVEDKGTVHRIKFKEGSIVTVSEVFPEQLAEIHKKSLDVMSKCSTKTLKEIRKLCELNMNDEPLVSLYINRSYYMTNLLEEAYREIGKPNSLHYFVKEISPEIYGKAQTFMDRIAELYSMIEEVLSFKENEVSEKRSKLKIIGERN